jgi:hypothetical protein
MNVYIIYGVCILYLFMIYMCHRYINYYNYNDINRNTNTEYNKLEDGLLN